MTTPSNAGSLNRLLQRPWFRAYWFARMLINSDKYGGIGSDTRTLAEVASGLRAALEANRNLPWPELAELLNSTLDNVLKARYQHATAKKDRVALLCHDLRERLLAREDFEVFILTCESIMIPINEALALVPSDDKTFVAAQAKAYFDSLGERALPTIINIWDDLGLTGCLNAERAQVVRVFGDLRRLLQRKQLNEDDSDLVLTALVQEFERRLGQKRKGRGGRSLEDVTSFILSYFKIPAGSAPEHFQADIEVDKWVRTFDRWLIGISCKRTLRERWKQVSSADRNLLSRFKIRSIWHVITYDEDLSDEKLALLGGHDHIFYLRDDSRCYRRATDHPGLKGYVRPMSRFVSDLRGLQQKRRV